MMSSRKAATSAPNLECVSPRKTGSETCFEEGHQRRVELVGTLHVGHVAKARQQDEFSVAVRDGLSHELHPFLEDGPGETVLSASEHQGGCLDVCPVVDDGIEICNLTEERLNHRQSWPVGAQRPRVPDARVLF